MAVEHEAASPSVGQQWWKSDDGLLFVYYNNFISPSRPPIPASAVCGVARLTCGVLGKLRRDESNTVSSLDPYAQTEARLGESWRVLAGARELHSDGTSRYSAAGASQDDLRRAFG